MRDRMAITLAENEVTVLLSVLSNAYERALETRLQQSRGSGEQIEAREPIDEGSAEDSPPVQPDAEVIKAIEEKILEAYLE